jgi:hypothetical protein
MKERSKVEKFRNGVFLASSRTYGEKFIEPIIRQYFNLRESTDNSYDAICPNNLKYEIKASKVLLVNSRKKTSSLFDTILLEGNNYIIDRLVPFNNRTTSNYGSNIQNVKRDHFDKLIYVLLFEDCIKVFITNSTDIVKSSGHNGFKNWSDKHGRYDMEGKSGQFNITKSNIEWHLKNNLIATLSWNDVCEIAEGIK